MQKEIKESIGKRRERKYKRKGEGREERQRDGGRGQSDRSQGQALDHGIY